MTVFILAMVMVGAFMIGFDEADELNRRERKRRMERDKQAMGGGADDAIQGQH